MENADPVEVALLATVIANGVPAEIVVFPKRPEIIFVFDDNDSPSENSLVELFWVLEPM